MYEQQTPPQLRSTRQSEDKQLLSTWCFEVLSCVVSLATELPLTA